MAARTVRVPPAIVGGQQIAEGGQQIVVTARAEFDDRDTRRRVRDEDVQQSVTRPVDERRALRREVEDDFRNSGPHIQHRALHNSILLDSGPRRCHAADFQNMKHQ